MYWLNCFVGVYADNWIICGGEGDGDGHLWLELDFPDALSLVHISYLID